MGPGRPIIAGMHTTDIRQGTHWRCFRGPVRDWFAAAFPGGPTPAQRLAWPPIAAGENVLLVSPTGTGKTLAAFLAILDRLFRAHAGGTLAPGLAVRLRLAAAEPGLRHRAEPVGPAGRHPAAARADGEPGARGRAHGRHLGLRTAASSATSRRTC